MALGCFLAQLLLRGCYAVGARYLKKLAHGRTVYQFRAETNTDKIFAKTAKNMDELYYTYYRWFDYCLGTLKTTNSKDFRDYLNVEQCVNVFIGYQYSRLLSNIINDKTYSNYKYCYNHVDFLQSKIQDVSRIDLIQNGITKPSQMQAWRSLFSFLAEHKILSTEPVLQVQKKSDVVIPPTELELYEYLNAFEPMSRERIFIELLATTGLRKSEAFALQLQDIRDGDLVIRRRVVHGKVLDGLKSGKIRMIKISPKIRRNLQSLINGQTFYKGYSNNAGWLFAGKKGIPVIDKMFISRFLASKSGNKYIECHKLRHYAASRWLQSGFTFIEVAAMLGHKTPETTARIYAHLLQKVQRQAPDLEFSF